MKLLYPLLCLAALAACEGNAAAPNGSITGALKPGMTEQQVAEVSNNRVPDRVVMATCGTETPKPFACKVFVYEGVPRPVSSTRGFRWSWRMSEDNGKLVNGSESFSGGWWQRAV